MDGGFHLLEFVLFVVVVYFINIMEDDNELLEMPNYLIAGIMCYSSAVVAMIITAMGMDIHRYIIMVWYKLM